MIAVRIFVGVAAHGGTKDWNAAAVVQTQRMENGTLMTLLMRQMDAPWDGKMDRRTAEQQEPALG